MEKTQNKEVVEIQEKKKERVKLPYLKVFNPEKKSINRFLIKVERQIGVKGI
jgi:hypothetical protein